MDEGISVRRNVIRPDVMALLMIHMFLFIFCHLEKGRTLSKRHMVDEIILYEMLIDLMLRHHCWFISLFLSFRAGMNLVQKAQGG